MALLIRCILLLDYIFLTMFQPFHMEHDIIKVTKLPLEHNTRRLGKKN